uniref:uncharacterized protein LOC120344865 n=1 Tax=Styela clava TaxID=7725 RepID=UPI00193AB53E|nr:uncharacterized protein LOC120344865 [Styela clava]
MIKIIIVTLTTLLLTAGLSISATERCEMAAICDEKPVWMTVPTNKDETSYSAQDCDRDIQRIKDHMAEFRLLEKALRKRLNKYKSLKQSTPSNKDMLTSTATPADITTEPLSPTTDLLTIVSTIDSVPTSTVTSVFISTKPLVTTTYLPTTTSIIDCTNNWNEPTSYTYVGCYNEETPFRGGRVIATVEGQYPTVSGSYRARTNAIQKCARIAFCLGYQVFALQDGGWCATSENAHLTFSSYGRSSACPPGGGEGVSATNAVYKITNNF